ncbi:MAG: alpha-amylase family glycosyl hydrolase [Acidimicrobiales bacterium]
MDDTGIAARVVGHVEAIWPGMDPDDRARLSNRLMDAIGIGRERLATDSANERWSENDVVLIAYGDSITSIQMSPLAALRNAHERHFCDAFSIVHVLPFFPYSSDRGFAVLDHREVDAALGSWDDMRDLAAAVDLMVDLVANHASTESRWFAEFLSDEDPGRSYFVTASPDDDLSAVVRPRSQPLLTSADTKSGERWVWTTFGADQADLDWSNPDLVCEMLDIIDLYVDAGARLLRLDAIAYLWKEQGTSCVHLRQTHEFVKLLRSLLQLREPRAALVTETNVPDDENRSYFGDGDEAHVVYNFTLPPLLVDAVINERADRLGAWLQSTPPPPHGCTTLNFLSSHDGIGLRPAEGLLNRREIQRLVDVTHERGGLHSDYDRQGVPTPYELNISLPDLFGGPDDEHMVARVIVAHSIVLVLAGIPAVYVNSLLATTNTPDEVEAEGVRRAINRTRIDIDNIPDVFSDSWRASIMSGIIRRAAIRRSSASFHPESPQTVEVNGALLRVARMDADGNIVEAMFNLSSVDVQLDLSRPVRDLISGIDASGRLTLPAFGDAWLSARADAMRA